MDATALRAMQAPLKERYKGDPQSAVITLKAKGSIPRLPARSRPAARLRSRAWVKARNPD